MHSPAEFGPSSSLDEKIARTAEEAGKGLSRRAFIASGVAVGVVETLHDSPKGIGNGGDFIESVVGVAGGVTEGIRGAGQVAVAVVLRRIEGGLGIGKDRLTELQQIRARLEVGA